MNKKTVKDIDVNGKKVLVRVDFNVPLDENKNITDETRINAALPTIKYLLENGAAVILCSHLGRPKGEFNMKYSLAPVAARLEEIFPGIVTFASDVIGESADIDRVCNHVLHFIELDPECRHIALGADFDGCDALPEGISGVDDYPKLARRLSERGVDEDMIKRIYWENAMGVMEKCCT